nr:hypothetical protein HJG59_002633 [Molossus molossus]
MNVFFPVLMKPRNPTAFTWYRGKGMNFNCVIAFTAMDLRICATGPAYSGREKINCDGSLMLKNITTEDTGIYTVVVHSQNFTKEVGYGRLTVHSRENAQSPGQ